MHINVTYNSFVALGDSFTEGMSDGLPDGSYRGWADLLAARLAARTEGFRYANLAVRGKLIRQIADEQVDTAASMDADLVTLVGGLNDTLRPKCDVDEVCALLEQSVQLFRSVDELAARHGAVVVDLYGAGVLGDPRMWADDRLHLNAEGHRRVAEAVWQALGHLPGHDWTEPLPAALPLGWATRRGADLRFTREHLVPWIGRRLTGRSSGDGLPPKRAELLPYEL
jgi:lysophospholipase L1-like esterase